MAHRTEKPQTFAGGSFNDDIRRLHQKSSLSPIDPTFQTKQGKSGTKEAEEKKVTGEGEKKKTRKTNGRD